MIKILIIATIKNIYVRQVMQIVMSVQSGIFKIIFIITFKEVLLHHIKVWSYYICKFIDIFWLRSRWEMTVSLYHHHKHHT